MTALGVYDIGGDGLPLESDTTGVDVGLWDDTGTLLGQVLVAGGTDAPILDGFRYESLATSIGLTSGEFYRVGADMSDISGTVVADSAFPDTVNGIDSIQEAYGDPGFNFPASLVDSNEALLGGNILFEDATSTSVPFEFSPGLGLLLVGGLFGGGKLYRSYRSSKIEM